MLYKPLKERLWDSWLVNKNDKYYLFYIRVSENGTRWDGISLAISDDLIHWQEIGSVLEKDEDAIWLGTGMIQMIGNEYIMNYSQEKPAGEQKIYFAKSYNLINWEKVPNIVFEPDGKIYEKSKKHLCDPYPRWDSLGIVSALENEKPPYFAFSTACSAISKYPQKNGVLGFFTSNDGLNWKHLKPATEDLNLFPAYEVPEHLAFDERHYVIFCTSSKLGFRHDYRAKYLSGGSYYVYSQNLEGPYSLPDGDPMLAGSRDVSNVTMNSVGRVIKENGEYLYYHIWGNPIADAWLGMIKKLVEVKPGRLELRYWQGNDKMKDLISNFKADQLKWQDCKQIGYLPSVDWNISEDSIAFTNRGSSGGLLSSDLLFTINHESVLSDGIIVEFSLSRLVGLGFGIFFITKSGGKICAFSNFISNRLEFSRIVDGFGSNLVLENLMSKENPVIEYNELNYKVFLREYFIEVYINDVFISGYRLEEPIRSQQIGLYSEDCTGILTDLHIFQMK